MMRQQRITEGVLLLTVFIWGVNTPLMKMGLGYLSPLLYNAFRLLLASIFAWVILLYSGTYKPIKGCDIPSILAIGLLGFCCSQLLLMIGLPHTTAGNASIMNALLPLTVILMNRIFKKEAISFFVIVGMLVSLVGITCVVLGSDKNISLDSNHVMGAALILLSQFGVGYYTIFSRDLLERYSAHQIIAYVMTLSAIVFSMVAIPEVSLVSWRDVPIMAWISIFISGLFALLLANVAWIWCVGKLGSTRASLFQNLVPLFAIIGAWILLGEVLTWLQWLGMILVFNGLYLARANGNKKILVRLLEHLACTKS